MNRLLERLRTRLSTRLTGTQSQSPKRYADLVDTRDRTAPTRQSSYLDVEQIEPARPHDELFFDYSREPAQVSEYKDSQGVFYGDRPYGYVPLEQDYSHDENRDRFSALPEFVRHLAEYLNSTFDVTLTQEEPVDPALPQFSTGYPLTAAYKLVPHAQNAQSVTLGSDTFPGVLLTTGAQDAGGTGGAQASSRVQRVSRKHGSDGTSGGDLQAFPRCGCDACDDTYDSVAQDVERAVFDIVCGDATHSAPWTRRDSHRG